MFYKQEIVSDNYCLHSRETGLLPNECPKNAKGRFLDKNRGLTDVNTVTHQNIKKQYIILENCRQHRTLTETQKKLCDTYKKSA